MEVSATAAFNFETLWPNLIGNQVTIRLLLNRPNIVLKLDAGTSAAISNNIRG